MVAMATNSNITVPQNYTTKYSNLVHGWDTSHPTTISKRFIILIYHYLHAVPGVEDSVTAEGGPRSKREASAALVGLGFPQLVPRFSVDSPHTVIGSCGVGSLPLRRLGAGLGLRRRGGSSLRGIERREPDREE